MLEDQPKRALPEMLLPEMRQRWVLYQGAKQAADAAARAAEQCHAQYQDMLNTALQIEGYDPTQKWQVNLANGEVRPAQDAAQVS